MPVDPWLAVEAVGFLVALALAVYGVAKLDIKLTAAAGVVAVAIWLLAAWSNPIAESAGREYTTLRFRVIDQATAIPVRRARIRVIALDERNREMRYRLPLTIGDATNGNPSEIITVSLFISQRIRGSLLQQFRHPEACLELEDQVLEVAARGYLPWRGSLKQLLLDRGQSKAGIPMTIELRRREMGNEG